MASSSHSYSFSMEKELMDMRENTLTMIMKYVCHATTLLSKKYQFDVKEALDYLSEHPDIHQSSLNSILSLSKKENTIETQDKNDGDVKKNEERNEQPSNKDIVKKTEHSNHKKTKIPLPFVGVVYEEKCKAIKLNHGLHTQCNNNHLKTGDYCSVCQKQSEKNANGKPNYGDIRERLNCGLLEYRDVKGQLTKPYVEVVEKLKLSKEDIESECENMGIKIPEEHWVKREKKRGRPKNTNKTNQEKNTNKSGRGRPKKSKEVKSEVGDDLLEALKNAENNDNKQDKHQEEDKQQEQEDAIKVIEKIENNKEDDDDDHDIQETISRSETQYSQFSYSIQGDKEDEEEEEEEGVIVDEFELNGVKYLKTDDNILYNYETKEVVGEWNPETNEISDVVIDDSDDDE